jgi:hypothetical protein
MNNKIMTKAQDIVEFCVRKVRALRSLSFLLLMMVVGVNNARGQAPLENGYYMIASSGGPNAYSYSSSNRENNFYLCPATACFYDADDNTHFLTQDNGKPHLTTYKCFAHNAVSDALWHVTSVTVSNTLYYRFYHVASEKYLTYNTGRKISNNSTRLIVHLEAFETPDENNTLFIVTASDGKFLIRPKNVTDESKALNVSSDNLDQTNPGSNKGGIQGTIGYYNISGNDVAASYWYFEVPNPVISYDSSNQKIVVSHIDENANIYYTTDDTDPSTEQTENKGVHSVEIADVNSSTTIKAIAERAGIVSHISEIRVVPSANISLGTTPIYNGSAQEPTVTVMDGTTEIPTTEYTVSYSNNTNAGNTATVTITDNDGGNYIVYGSTTFTINPKPLTITAKPKTITYGDAPANDGVTYGEFAGEETESVLTGTLAYSYNYEQYGDAGSYKITPSGLSNSNYDITFIPGTLTVNPKEVTVTSGITASDKSYDGTTDATLNGTTAVIEGKIGSDDLTVVSGMGTFEDKDVGTDKTVTINSFTFGGAKAGNYQMAVSGHQATAQASITPAALSVTAEAKSKTFGDADPEFTYTSDGLIGEDAITGLLSRAEGENVGTYAITQGTLTAGGNYSITLISANLTISPKTIGDGNNAADGITIQMSSAGELETVKDGEITLLENTDYTQEITEDGQDKLVIVTGMGNYTGSAKGIYANPTFTKPAGSDKATAVYKAKRDMAKPSDIKPYIVRKVNPTIGTLTISEIDYIPEDVPVLLLSDEESEGFTAAPKEEATAAITAQTKNSNLLKVAPKDGVKVEAAQIYTFYKGEFVLTKKGTLSEGKFYIYNPNYTATPAEEEEQQQGGGNAPSLSTLRFVIEEESTGVSDARSKMEDVRGDWYTLDGRKLSGKPTKAGLYIKNGRKTVIKRK